MRTWVLEEILHGQNQNNLMRLLKNCAGTLGAGKFAALRSNLVPVAAATAANRSAAALHSGCHQRVWWHACEFPLLRFALKPAQLPVWHRQRLQRSERALLPGAQ